LTERQALQKRRQILLGKLAEAADEFKRIDDRLTFLLEGRKPGSGAA